METDVKLPSLRFRLATACRHQRSQPTMQQTASCSVVGLRPQRDHGGSRRLAMPTWHRGAARLSIHESAMPIPPPLLSCSSPRKSVLCFGASLALKKSCELARNFNRKCTYLHTSPRVAPLRPPPIDRGRGEREKEK